MRISKRSSPLRCGGFGRPPARHREGYRSGGSTIGDHPVSDVGRQHAVSLGGRGRLTDELVPRGSRIEVPFRDEWAGNPEAGLNDRLGWQFAKKIGMPLHPTRS